MSQYIATVPRRRFQERTAPKCGTERATPERLPPHSPPAMPWGAETANFRSRSHRQNTASRQLSGAVNARLRHSADGTTSRKDSTKATAQQERLTTSFDVWGCRLAMSRPNSAGESPLPSPRTHGGSRPNSGKKARNDTLTLHVCGFPKLGDGLPCDNTVKSISRVGCHLHDHGFASEFPELHRIVSAVKETFPEFFMGRATLSVDTLNILGVLWERMFDIIKVSRSNKEESKKKEKLADYYTTIESHLELLEVEISSADCSFLTAWGEVYILTRPLVTVGKVEEKRTAEKRLKEAKEAMEAQLMREAERMEKEAKALKLSNDIADLCGGMEDMEIPSTEPSPAMPSTSAPVNKIKAFRETDSSDD